MSKKSESNLNEMMAGDGSGLQLPPAFVMVNPRQHRKYKKNNQDKVDGRTIRRSYPLRSYTNVEK